MTEHRKSPESPLHRLLEEGQSYWLDNLSRPMLRDGELERRVREEGLRGVTSNPSIFRKAISGGEAYDDQIGTLVRERRTVGEIYEALAVRDIRDACDTLRPVHDASGGRDGFVSLEVSPYLARDTEGTIHEARRLFGAVDRPNVMIKIPGTREGLPAIETCLAEGLNINITLLFAVERYEEVAEAYLRALERRLEEGLPVDGVASVASFFLSRIDVLVDRLLSDRIPPGEGGRRSPTGEGHDGPSGDDPSGDAPRARELMGRAAVANAKVAYRRYQRIFTGERWERLREAGAAPQRLLWASTSTKDPLYDDVRYVEPLVGPDTVNTLPDETIAAFADHGRVKRTVDREVEEAGRVLEELETVGIDLARVTAQLEDEGIRKFVEPFDALLTTLARQRADHLGRRAVRDRIAPGRDAPDPEGVGASLDRRRFGRALFSGDPSAWNPGQADEASVARRLGWVDAPVAFGDRLAPVRELAGEVREEGFDHVVWLGMGGSSLAAEVTSRVLGTEGDGPAFLMLDDTDPAAVRDVAERVAPARTLFVVASKSGTTSETLAFYRHFRGLVEEAGSGDWASRFVAVTDPGTPLAREGREEGFRALFENPADIGGRYSALSFFGLVAMALQGVDVEDLLTCAAQMRVSCGPEVPAASNPGIRLGALLGAWARAGRDKVTLTGSPTLEPLTAWLEQLLAESTGKDGTGLVPVAGEPRAAPERYGPDRLFVHLRTEEDGAEPETEAWLDALEEAGHPVVRIETGCRAGLGAEFYRWEVATATAGAVLGVNPFDEPDVAAAKEVTRRLLEAWETEGAFPEAATGSAVPVVRAAEALSTLLRSLREGDYLALLPFLRVTPEREAHLDRLRAHLLERHGVPTQLGRGPRYLHSTGQLHKGGPETGVFLVLTADPGEDVPIPGRPYGFGTLQRAQALGDVGTLRERGRRVLHLHLGTDPDAGLERLLEAAGAGRAAAAAG